MQKNETGSFSYIIHKDKFKMMKDLKVRQDSIKILEENTGNTFFVFWGFLFLFLFLFCFVLQHPFWTWPQQLLGRYIYEGKRNKSKNELLGLNQDKKLLHSKRNSQQKQKQKKKKKKKKSTKLKDNHRMGEDICK